MKQFIINNWIYILPTSLFLIVGFTLFVALRTCISFTQIVEITLLILSFIFLLYYWLAKKYNLFELNYINLLLLAYIAPITLAIILALNYYTASIVYKEKIKILYYVADSNKIAYMPNKNDRPTEICTRLFEPKEGLNIQGKTYIETKIGKGILGFYVLKKQKAY